MKKVLITGCGGMLGSEVYPYFRNRCQHVLATDLHPAHRLNLQKMDVRDRGDVAMILSYRPDVVIHLAAETDLEDCEECPARAAETNVVGTANVARIVAQIGCSLVHVSTVGVFDGDKAEPYTEADAPRPVNVYGSTKLLGEQVARQFVPERLIVVRSGWMVGGGPDRDRKFVGNVLTQIQNGGRVVEAVTDKLGAPTSARDLAAVLYRLATEERWGTWHACGEGSASRYDAALEIVVALGREDVRVVPVTSSRFADRYWVPRPRNEAMSCGKLNSVGITLRPWREALREYVREWTEASR